MDRETFIAKLKELCDGDKMPDRDLFEYGRLPSGWDVEYLDLLQSNRMYWQNLESWPRDLMYCIYRVAHHHKFAYDEWAKNNPPDLETEKSLHQIRLFTEAFLTGSPHEKWDINI